MKKKIIAAEDTNPLDDIIDSVKSDFDYIIDGLDTLNRRGAESSKQAMSIASDISANLEQHITAIASALTNR